MVIEEEGVPTGPQEIMSRRRTALLPHSCQHTKTLRLLLPTHHSGMATMDPVVIMGTSRVPFNKRVVFPQTFQYSKCIHVPHLFKKTCSAIVKSSPPFILRFTDSVV